MKRVIYIAKKDPFNKNAWYFYKYSKDNYTDFYWSIVFEYYMFDSLSKGLLKATIDGIEVYLRRDDCWCLDNKYHQESLNKWFEKIS